MNGITSIRFDKQTSKLLDEMKEHYGASSKGEVVRKAVALLSLAIEAENEGAKLMIIGRDYKKELLCR